MDTQVSPQARAAIEALKDRIAEFVASAVAASGSDEPPGAIQRRLADHGGSAEKGREPDVPATRDMHGAWLRYDVAIPRGHPSLLGVVARFQINCGEDALLFLFERSGSVLAPVMIRRSRPYDEVSGAWQDFQFAVSPGDARRRWYVAIAHTPPWCTSAWRSIRYDLSRAGPTPAAPRLFFAGNVGTYIGYDRIGTLRAGAGHFQVEHDGGTLDPNILVRRHVEAYEIDGEAVRRIQPVAFNVRDFVDEWVSASWAEASDWSAPGLAAAHRAIGESIKHENSYYRFGPIRSCGRGVHQVVLDPVEVDHGFMSRPWHVFVRGDGPYRIDRVSASPSGSCLGPDLSQEIERESHRRMGSEPIS